MKLTGGVRRDLVTAVSSHAGVAVVMLLVQVSAARGLGAAGYGQYAAASAFASILDATLAARSGELALQLVGRRWLAGEWASARATAERIVSRDLRLFGMVFMVAAAASVPLGGLFDAPAGALVGALLAVPFQSGYGLSKALFITTGRVRDQSVLEFAFAAAQAVLGVAAAFTGSVVVFTCALSGATLLKTLVAWHISRQWWPEIPAEQLAAARADVARESWIEAESHSIGRNTLQYAAAQLDTLVLAAAAAPSEVGLYKAARTLAALPGRAAGPVWAVVRPRLQRAWHERDAATVRRILRGPAVLFLLVGLASLPVAWWLGPWVLRTSWGPAFDAATLPLVLLLVGTWVFAAATAWFPFWIVVAEQRWSGTRAYAILFLATLIGALAFGTRGAAWMAAAVSVASVLTAIWAWRELLRATRSDG